MAGRLIGLLIFTGATAALIVLVGGGVAFLRRPVGAAYLALWVLWWVAIALGRRRGAPTAHDRPQRLLVVASGVTLIPALVLLPPWEYAHFGGPIPRDGPLAWLGLALFAGGIALSAAAMRALHGAFTERLGVAPQQRLVTGGPYALVRHPGYLGYIVTILGMGLAMSSLGGLGLAAVVVPIVLWRIRGEEAMLVAEFGQAYRDYQRRTRKLIPLVH